MNARHAAKQNLIHLSIFVLLGCTLHHVAHEHSINLYIRD